MPVLEPVVRLTRDQRAAAATLGREEARYLVDTYYQMQRGRITADNQIRAAEVGAEPHATLEWFADNADILEAQIKGALGKYAEAHAAGAWALRQKGIGPVIAAGLISRLELRPTVGAWWRFCGLDPTVRWEKGQKRPWNAALKRLCWLAGESFVKVSGREDAYYGQVYQMRKALEVERNEAGAFADQAAASLAAKRFGDDTLARKRYEAGRLPDARLHLRAERYAVKLFLAHLHEVWHEAETGAPPPLPYAIAHLDHAHRIARPD